MIAETLPNPAFLAFLLENFVEDIVNLPINLSRAEIRSAKVVELYQRVRVLDEYITTKTSVTSDETTMDDNQPATIVENDDHCRLRNHNHNHNHTYTDAKMHKLSELADDARVKTICGIGDHPLPTSRLILSYTTYPIIAILVTSL